jgi:hypothetical protein
MGGGLGGAGAPHACQRGLHAGGQAESGGDVGGRRLRGLHVVPGMAVLRPVGAVDGAGQGEQLVQGCLVGDAAI